MEQKYELLIIEDKVHEIIYAQTDAIKAGINDVKIARNLEEAFMFMPHAKHIATDLFFPAGNLFKQEYIDMFLPMYQKYAETRFPEIGKTTPTFLAVSAVAELFGVTMQEFADNIFPKLNNPDFLIKDVKDVAYGRVDFDKYLKFMKSVEGMKNGENLPLGTIVMQAAQKNNIPAIIVTDTYHHDDLFSPVASMAHPYVDSLIDGRKNWAKGIEYLFKR